VLADEREKEIEGGKVRERRERESDRASERERHTE
jgi:hypothetical protein